MTVDHTGSITIRGPINGASILLDSDSPASTAISVMADLTSTSGDVTLDAVGGVALSGDVQVQGLEGGPAGVFRSTGASFNATGDIVVVDRGSIVLEHSGGVSIYGVLDAGSYLFAKNPDNAADVIIRGGALIKFYADVQTPPANPLLTMTGKGNLRFQSGSQIKIVTTEEAESIDAAEVILAQVEDGSVLNSGFNWLASGPSADAVDDVFADGNFLKLLINEPPAA